ncbi:hypothetical protein [Burkholderia cenocepacia]|uniref:hypothetical protein n=1 Tax=Burkholderia cenocepacia TaxID=95486 RepID=UPI002ABDF997|nr:hypothetical protein [Burkholderia cenocepacia]
MYFAEIASVGAMDAESDERFLRDCFLDTGDLDSLEDCQDPKRIVVGRVGAGIVGDQCAPVSVSSPALACVGCPLTIIKHLPARDTINALSGRPFAMFRGM